MTEQELKKVAEVVRLEVDMVITIAPKIVSETSFCNDVLIQSFLLHIRNLQEFFHYRASDIKPNGHNKDLVVAEHFLDEKDRTMFQKERPQMKYICEMEKDLHEYLAHISIGRARRGQINWNPRNMLSEINGVWKYFLNKLPESSKEWFTTDPSSEERELPQSEIDKVVTSSTTSDFVKKVKTSPDPI